MVKEHPDPEASADTAMSSPADLKCVSSTVTATATATAAATTAAMATSTAKHPNPDAATTTGDSALPAPPTQAEDCRVGAEASLVPRAVPSGGAGAGWGGGERKVAASNSNSNSNSTRATTPVSPCSSSSYAPNSQSSAGPRAPWADRTGMSHTPTDSPNPSQYEGAELSVTVPVASITDDQTGEEVARAVQDAASAIRGRARAHRPSYVVSRHGILVAEEEYKQQRQQKKAADLKKERALLERDTLREVKWVSMLQRWDTFVKKNRSKLKSRVRKGIPAGLRFTVWPSLLGAHQVKATAKRGLYESLLKETSGYEETIGRDINRTFPSHVLFRKDGDVTDEVMALDAVTKSEESMGQGALFRVLKAYSVYDAKVGYCQGLAFVAGLFLMYMPEEDAFWCLERYLCGEQYMMGGLYAKGFPLCFNFFYVFEQLMKKRHPRLAAHFAELHVEPALYSMQWFLTIFAYDFPMGVVLRLWDIFINEGVKIVFRMGLFIMAKLEKRLLAADMGGVVKILKQVHTEDWLQDTDAVIFGALRVPLSRQDIAKHSRAYEQQNASAPRR